jgi:hypothetical protein
VREIEIAVGDATDKKSKHPEADKQQSGDAEIDDKKFAFARPPIDLPLKAEVHRDAIRQPSMAPDDEDDERQCQDNEYPEGETSGRK